MRRTRNRPIDDRPQPMMYCGNTTNATDATMRKMLASFLVPLAVMATLGFAIIVLNQTLQLVELADRVHPTFGTAVLFAIMAIFAICIVVPAYAFLGLPKPLIPPSETAGCRR